MQCFFWNDLSVLHCNAEGGNAHNHCSAFSGKINNNDAEILAEWEFLFIYSMFVIYVDCYRLKHVVISY